MTFLRKYVVNPPRLAVEVDGRTVAGVSLFVQNAENYTYFNDRPVPLVEGARFDSGCLAGVVLTRARPYDVPTVTFRALSGAARIAKHRGVDAFGAFGEAVVRSADGRAIPIQVDGDHIADELEARFSVAPARCASSRKATHHRAARGPPRAASAGLRLSRRRSACPRSAATTAQQRTLPARGPRGARAGAGARRPRRGPPPSAAGELERSRATARPATAAAVRRDGCGAGRARPGTARRASRA